MARHQHSYTLTIPAAGTDSQVVKLAKPAQSIVDMLIFTPSALTGTVKLYVGYDDTRDTIAEMVPVYLNGADLTLPAARAVAVPIGAIRTIAVVSSGAEAVERVFRIVSQLEF